ncbi:MAG TPA: hypothetical protein VGN15_01865 [Ktedonobacteraceae bacterium]|nr:hypothetical protein [Ktedonobacteraceae bacterium]
MALVELLGLSQEHLLAMGLFPWLFEVIVPRLPLQVMPECVVHHVVLNHNLHKIGPLLKLSHCTWDNNISTLYFLATVLLIFISLSS